MVRMRTLFKAMVCTHTTFKAMAITDTKCSKQAAVTCTTTCNPHCSTAICLSTVARLITDPSHTLSMQTYIRLMNMFHPPATRTISQFPSVRAQPDTANNLHALKIGCLVYSLFDAALQHHRDAHFEPQHLQDELVSPVPR